MNPIEFTVRIDATGLYIMGLIVALTATAVILARLSLGRCVFSWEPAMEAWVLVSKCNGGRRCECKPPAAGPVYHPLPRGRPSSFPQLPAGGTGKCPPPPPPGDPERRAGS